MELTFELILAYVLLIPFIILNFTITFGSFFQTRLAKFTNKILNRADKIGSSPSRRLGFVFTSAWILVGIIGLLLLDNPLSLGGVLILLAFRGGAKLSSHFVFGLHDYKLAKNKAKDQKLIRFVSLAFQIALIIEILFLLIWGLLFTYLPAHIKISLGVDPNFFMLLLWALGFIFGFIYALIRSHGAQEFLLKNELVMVLLLSGYLLKESGRSNSRLLPL